jgi:hypothetical protein
MGAKSFSIIARSMRKTHIERKGNRQLHPISTKSGEPLKRQLHPDSALKLFSRGHILIATTSPKSSSHLYNESDISHQQSGRVKECKRMREKGWYH